MEIQLYDSISSVQHFINLLNQLNEDKTLYCYDILFVIMNCEHLDFAHIQELDF